MKTTHRWTGGEIGVVGVGQLGTALSGNLLRAGIKPILFDIKGKTPAVQGLLSRGCKWAESCKELAQRSEVVITGLPRPEHVSAAMGIVNLETSTLTPDGILAGLQPNSVWIEHSTTDFNNTLKIKELVEARKCFAVEAPVTGGMTVLKEGKMVALVAGENSVLERIAPIVELSCPTMVNCGRFGHATVIKILSNMLCAVNDCAMGEAMMIARKSGVDMKVLFDAIRISSGNSFCWETEAPLALQGSYDPDFTAENMVKDLNLGQDLAKKLQVPFMVHGLTTQIYEQAMAKFGKTQGSTIPVKLIEDLAGESAATESSKADFKGWTYSTQIKDGAFQVLQRNTKNPYENRSRL